MAVKKLEGDIFDRKWLISNAVRIISSYRDPITIRQLHYRLVAAGMFNTNQHYKRLVAAMGVARREGIIQYDAFRDLERDVVGSTQYEETDVESTVSQRLMYIRWYLKNYSKNMWENQPIYPEVFIEKKALQGVFEKPCQKFQIALSPCKGYPSMTFLYEAAQRFQEAIDEGRRPVILYFGDFDPSGEDIPRSIEEVLRVDMGVTVELRRIALLADQVEEWELPPAPTKSGDTRSASWDGVGQVELDAVEPLKLVELVTEAIESVFDHELYSDLLEIERDERKQFVTEMRTETLAIFDDGEEEEDDEDEDY